MDFHLANYPHVLERVNNGRCTMLHCKTRIFNDPDASDDAGQVRHSLSYVVEIPLGAFVSL